MSNISVENKGIVENHLENIEEVTDEVIESRLQTF